MKTGLVTLDLCYVASSPFPKWTLAKEWDGRGNALPLPACSQPCPWGHQPQTAGKSGPWLSLPFYPVAVLGAFSLVTMAAVQQEPGRWSQDLCRWHCLVHYNASSLVKNANDSFHFILWQTVLVAVTGCSLHLPITVEVAMLTLCKRLTTLLIDICIFIHTYTGQPTLLAKPPPGKMIFHCPLVDQMQRANILSKQIRVVFYFRIVCAICCFNLISSSGS